ncbi:spermidine/putrescine ABC transporter substrate-binding protein [Clostridium sp.]|jgi:spermidine/putrescine transport system substrate-binding protein|uniref:ABC transporter substrate-binding protein n=1 Tax=Clostridium sp. TaxID=1506 RepID=UPI0025C3221A|nr:spermidine/putrescine ABC transporter substrate-binding protein [Clostridium sp.]MCI9069651.1 spermidine/putrescine ABC transporter substrate-binding protein [Clostridium sp.]
MKKRKFKFIAVVLSVLFVANSFVACNKKKYDVTINFLNWGENIAEGLIDEFQEKYNIGVNEIFVDDNEAMYQELISGKTQYDVAVPGDYMVERLIAEDRLEKLDKDAIPNWIKLSEDNLDRPFDKGNIYSLPYMNGTIGIVYNKDIIKENVDSWKDMWNPEYRDEIFVLDSQRDAIGMALKMLGYPLNSTDPEQLKEAEEALIKQKELGTIYGADNVKDLMISGERAIAMIWSGEGLNLADEYDYLEYVVPKEGANFWIDSLVIPKGTENKESAETFINFLCDTDNAYKIAEEIGYTTPNKEAMLKQPDNVKNNKGAYIPKEIMDKCEGYKYLTQDELKMYDDVWMKVKG